MTITILLTYEFKIRQKKLSKMSSMRNISSLYTGKVQTTFFKLTNGILKTEMWTKDKTKRLSKKQEWVSVIAVQSDNLFMYKFKFKRKRISQISSGMMNTSRFDAKGLEPEDTTLIIFFGGVAVVLDLLQTRKRWIFLPFSRHNVLIDINTLTIKNSVFLRKFFWTKMRGTGDTVFQSMGGKRGKILFSGTSR